MSELIGQKQVEVEEVSAELKNIVEALIFASDEPVTARLIRTIAEEVNKDALPGEQLAVDAESVKQAVTELNRGYARAGTAFRIIQIAGGYVHATREEFALWVGKLAKEKARRRLSVTAVESLAIIAYKQPITKSEVEFIRGVNVDYIMKTLLEKDLIYIAGRAHTPGRPLLYGTTQKFLEHFGLNDIADLPKPREIEELIGETEAEVDKRLLAEQQELEFRESLEGKKEGHEGTKQKPREQLSRTRRTLRRPEGETAPVNGEPGVQPIPSSAPDEAAIAPTAGIAETMPPDGSIIDQSRVTVMPADEAPPTETAPSTDKREQRDEPSRHSGNIPEADEHDETTHEAVQEPPAVGTIMPGEPAANTTAEIEPLASDLTTPEPEDVAPTGSGTASPWSRWKTKVKSFFQKIFG